MAVVVVVVMMIGPVVGPVRWPIAPADRINAAIRFATPLAKTRRRRTITISITSGPIGAGCCSSYAK